MSHGIAEQMKAPLFETKIDAGAPILSLASGIHWTASGYLMPYVLTGSFVCVERIGEALWHLMIFDVFAGRVGDFDANFHWGCLFSMRLLIFDAHSTFPKHAAGIVNQSCSVVLLVPCLQRLQTCFMWTWLV